MWILWCLGTKYASDKPKQWVSYYRLRIIFKLVRTAPIRNIFYKESRNIMKSLLGTFLFLMIAKTTQACSVCFYGDPTEKMNVALRQGIIVLLVVLIVVLGLFIKFFLSVAKRSKQGLHH